MRESELKDKIRSIINDYDHDFRPFSKVVDNQSETVCKRCSRYLQVRSEGDHYYLTGNAIDTNCILLEVVVNRGRSKDV